MGPPTRTLSPAWALLALAFIVAARADPGPADYALLAPCRGAQPLFPPARGGAGACAPGCARGLDVPYA